MTGNRVTGKELLSILYSAYDVPVGVKEVRRYFMGKLKKDEFEEPKIKRTRVRKAKG